MSEGTTSEPPPGVDVVADVANADVADVPHQASRANCGPAARALVRQAVLNAVKAWASDGWPAHLPAHSVHQVQGHLEEYIALCFPDQFSWEVRTSIAVVALKASLAQAHPAALAEAPTVDDLLHAVMDEALDRLESGDPLRPSLHSRAIESGSRDQEIVWEIFGNHVPRKAVLDALKVTLARRETLEFHVVTKYLDLTDVGKSRPTLGRVVEALQPVSRELGLPTITEAEVQSALFRFCNRLPHDA